MITEHFYERWMERMKNQKIPNELQKKLLRMCYKVLEYNYGQDELICLVDFNKLGYDFYKNELWIVIKENKLISIFFRSSYCSNKTFGSRVKNVSYVWNWLI